MGDVPMARTVTEVRSPVNVTAILTGATSVPVRALESLIVPENEPSIGVMGAQRRWLAYGPARLLAPPKVYAPSFDLCGDKGLLTLGCDLQVAPQMRLACSW
jgi:hypothetical protein